MPEGREQASLGSERKTAGKPRRASVMVVDDDAIVRSWLKDQLAGTDFQIVAEAGSPAEAYRLLETVRPQIMLVDQRLPGGPGTEAVRRMRANGLLGDTRVLMLTAVAHSGFNDLARRCGAQGTLLKASDPESLLTALRTIRAGRTWFDPRHPAGTVTLSPRERDVLTHLSRGVTNREIAEALGVGSQTVKTLVSRIYTKLGVHRRAEAVTEAIRLGLL
jgi:DNA-binding NarL/FixJ family response regulator